MGSLVNLKGPVQQVWVMTGVLDLRPTAGMGCCRTVATFEEQGSRVFFVVRTLLRWGGVRISTGVWGRPWQGIRQSVSSWHLRFSPFIPVLTGNTGVGPWSLPPLFPHRITGLTNLLWPPLDNRPQAWVSFLKLVWG